jgi:ABC-2 type transport system ATP-binding protein
LPKTIGQRASGVSDLSALACGEQRKATPETPCRAKPPTAIDVWYFRRARRTAQRWAPRSAAHDKTIYSLLLRGNSVHMLSIIGKDVRVEFPIYGHYARSLKHSFGLRYLAQGVSRLSGKGLNVGGRIRTGDTGRYVVRALDGISFEIVEGDRVGILGQNGAGKSTLLRTLAGIYEPIDGTIRTTGRTFPLFDLQLGMDQEATGLENIWLRGKMLGLTTKQIKLGIDDVAEFTELGEYLHMPMRTYSTGMALRLAFAISTAIAPEILILDEMIGAGDAAFLAKAEVRLKNFLARTGILVIASHSKSMLRQWCNKGMLLEHGKLIAYGPLVEVAARYEAMAQSG